MAKNTVIVSITANAKGLQKALGDSQSSLGSFGKIAGAAALAVGAAVVGIGIKAVKSASQLEQSMGGLGAVFKDNTGQMEKWATQAAGSVGLAKSEYAGLATVIGAQLKNMGVSTDQLAGQTNDLVVLGADLAAQFGGSTSDAVGALSSLLRGERDPIERYGVSLKQVDIDAKLAAMGMSGLTGEAGKQANTLATLELLYAQTADAQGAFARESTTLAGAQQRLRAGTENLFATFGTALLPAVTAVTAVLGTLVNTIQGSDAFAAFTGTITGASNAFADFIFGILNGTSSLDFGSMFSGLLDAAVNGITAASTWLATGGAATLVNGLVSGRAAFFDAAFQLFPVILEALVAAIPAIVTGLVALVSQLAQMLVVQAPIILAGAVTLFTTLLDAIVTILPGLVTTLLGLLPVILASVLGMIPALLDAAIDVFTSLVDALPVILPLLITAIVKILPKLIETLLNMIPRILDAAIKLFTSLVKSLPIILPLLITAVVKLLPKIITTLLNMIPTLLNSAFTLFSALVTAIPKILPKLIPALVRLLPSIIGAILSMVPALVGAGVNLIQGLIRGIGQMAGAVGGALINIAKGAIAGFKAFLGIKSPSRLFMGFGDNLGKGLAIGIDKSGKYVTGSLDGLSSLVANGFDASLSTGELQLAVTGSGYGSSGGNTYNVEVHTLNPTAETGRVIVQSIRDYERAGGRL